MRGLDPAWRKAHLVGIGGAGMSAIARVLHEGGLSVSGSDLRESALLNTLRNLGILIQVGHHARHVQKCDLVIASAAVPQNNPEVRAAKSLGIPVLTRGEALARIVEGMRTVSVSGTHGKTTTCGMIATILDASGLDPTYLLGADLAPRGAGGRLGKSEIAVVEADEAYGSFKWLKPSIAVVTNIDEDHMDHYGTNEALDEAFRQFVSHATEQSIICADDARAMSVCGTESCITYGFSERATLRVSEFQTHARGSIFQLASEGQSAVVELNVAGRHNALNAVASAAACLALGLSMEAIAAGLKSFQGVTRRFEFRGRFMGADLFDDYAHHPAEIEATLNAAASGPWRRIVAVFQPHLYSRTQALWRQFGDALCAADLVVVTDIYGAREQPIAGVTGKMIVEAACEQSPGKRIGFLPRLDDAAAYLQTLLQPGDLLLTLGAGDVTTLHDRFVGDGASVP